MAASETRDAFSDRRGDWMQTYSGSRFWPLDPRPSEVSIRDIAHALSMQCRFGGHCLRFYSVAEHSVHLARYALGLDRRVLALWMLLHDGSEAYVLDMVRPLKRFMPAYRTVEDEVQRAIVQRFGLDPTNEPPEVKQLDKRILIDERAQVMKWTGESWNYGGETIPLGVALECWDPMQAEAEFLLMFHELTAEA